MNQTAQNRPPLFSDGPEGRVHHTPCAKSPALRAVAKRNRGFTLIEVLVTVGIIVLLIGISLPAILIAKRHGSETRIRSDLALIDTAIQAYKADFGGQYPQFADPLSDQGSININGNGTWLDYSEARGAVLLCRALIGPGPANTNKTAPYYANPGDDGADGTGFRMRINATGINSATGYPILTGKVYGATGYLDPSKFSVQYLNAALVGNGTNGANFTQAYPAIFETVAGDWTDPKSGQAYKGSPILYYPAAGGNLPTQLYFTTPSSTTANSNSRFNGFDNDYLLNADMGGSYNPVSDFGKLAAGAGSLDYLLWTAGLDGHFGLANGKSDDITNFDLPANLKK